MQTNDEIRRARLGLLIAEEGSATLLAQKTDKSPAQISQWITGARDSKTGRPRTMSDDVARHLEQRTNKPRGWMDQPLLEVTQDSASSGSSGWLKHALDQVLDALAACPDRAELRQLLPMLVDTNAQAYRERLHQLLDGSQYSPTIDRVVRAKLDTETKDITSQGTHTDAGSRN